MFRRSAVCLIALAALIPVPAAAGDAGPSPGLMQGWTGVTAPNLPQRYVTLSAPKMTMLASVRKADGRVVNWRSFDGYLGVPLVAADGTAGGLTRDGRMLVLADWAPPANGGLRTLSRFELLNTRSFRIWKTIELRGDFAFDALSPGGRTLYLIQHVSDMDATRYLVRAYDLASDRLLPKAIADRRQKGWVMSGYPLKRATSADGRWVYTLYRQDGGYPFVHALDTVGRSAVCVGVPWTGNRDRLPSARLLLDEREGKLTVLGAGGREYAIDTRTFHVSLPSRREDGFPTAVAAGAGGGAAALALLVTGLWRRRSPKGSPPFTASQRPAS